MKQKIVDAAAKAFSAHIERELRHGGQKYVAQAKVDSKTVVLKIVELLPPNADVALERAKREVGLLRRIDSPRVVKIEAELAELGAAPDGVAWLERYLDGTDLWDQLGVQWPWTETARMCDQVAEGLEAIHAAGAVHRDLSPGNIRCLNSGDYVVMDPGLARHLLRTTVTGLFEPGTPGYLSPEHVSPVARCTPASDVFSLGVLMYQALSGDVPIPVTADPAEYSRALRTSNAPSIGQARPDLTPEQQALVDTCLQRQAARRYLDATELRTSLRSVR